MAGRKVMNASLKLVGILAILAIPMQSNAVVMTFNDSQTVPGPINSPGPFMINFATPMFPPVSDAILLTTSLGDWSFEGSGGALVSSESMSVTLEGNLVIDDLFHLNANLDAGSPTKNDNSMAIFQSVLIPQALIASVVGDGVLSFSYVPRFQVNIAGPTSFLTGEITYDFDDGAAVVPEPATLVLLGLGLSGLGIARKRRSAHS